MDTTELKKTINRLMNLVEQEPNFKIFDSYYVEKNKCDDLKCYIDMYLPNEYKKYAKNNQGKKQRKLQSYEIYKRLNALFTPSLFNKNYYSINIRVFKVLIRNFLSLIDHDIKYVENLNV